MKKVTIYDVSKKLGISTATINRALSGKPRVSEETRKLVIATADEMGFKANKAAMSLARKTIKIGFLLDEGIHDFNNEVLRGAKKACEELADYNVLGDFEIMGKPNTRQKMINRMIEMGEAGYDGIVTSLSGDLKDYHDVMEMLSKKNILVVTVISDILNGKRLFSVRNNGRVSGKMAGQLLQIMTPDKPIAVFTGYKDSGIHKENIKGFMEQMIENPLQVVAIYENYDDPDIAYHVTDKLLREYPDLGGIYIGTANSVTVCKKIVELGLSGMVKIVASDIFPELNEYLKIGVIQATIFQQPFNQGKLAFKCLYEHIAEGKDFGDEILLKPQIVMSSNLELFLDN